jgi:tetratricopeptide (TPR) repeat protein
MNLQRPINYCLYALVLLMPIFFLPWTISPLETNKQILLVVLITVASFLAVLEAFKNGRIVLGRHPVNYFLFFLLAAVILSAVFSKNYYLAFVGGSYQEYTSVITLAAAIIVFWLISGRGQEQKTISRLIFFALLGATLAGLVGIFSGLHIYLPFSFAQNTAFNTVGTMNALAIFLITMTLLANGFFLVWKGKGRVLPILTFLLSIITVILLAMIGYYLLWVILLTGSTLIIVAVFLRAHQLHHTKKYFLTLLLAVLAVVFIIFSFPKLVTIPAEVTPNASASWAIAKQTLAENSWLFGSGPGTYLFDYAKYHPLSVNQTNFWNIRFDRAGSGFLTFLPTMGLLPTIAVFLVALCLLVIALRRIKEQKDHRQWLALAILPAWLTLFLAWFFYTSNLTLLFLFFVLSGALYSLADKKTKIISTEKSPRGKIISSLGLVVAAIFGVTIIFLSIQYFSAETAFARAVKTDRHGGDLKEVISLIDQAASLNHYNDTYYRNLAESLILEAKREISTIASGSSPNEEQNKYLQALIAASINAARRGADLEPRQPANWLELASVYREVIPLISGAGDFALAAGQTTVALEPNNPYDRVELGKTYLVLAAAATDKTKQTEYYAAAEKSFNEAITLKTDYANAHYQLAVAYERQGKLNETIEKMESVINYNPRDVGAFFELGLLYLRRLESGDLEKAITALTKATTLLPSYSNAHWYLASAYEQKGDREAAIAEIEKVLELNPDNELVKTRLSNLKNGTVTEATTEPIE